MRGQSKLRPGSVDIKTVDASKNEPRKKKKRDRVKKRQGYSPLLPGQGGIPL